MANDNLFTFNSEIIDNAIKELHKRGKFSAKILDTDAGKALIEENDRILSKAVDNGLKDAIKSGLKYEISNELKELLKDNTFIFSGFKAYHTMNEAGLSLLDSKGELKSLREFKKEAGEVFEKQKLNLRSEYQHAVHTAQMAAKWQDIERDGDRYDLQYRTAGDDKVRESHIALDRITLPPSDPFWSEFYPPNGWGCRCTAQKVRKGKYKNADSAAAITKGDATMTQRSEKIFKFNAGKKGVIFPPKHPNFPKGCDGCDGKLNLAFGKGKPECDSCKIIQSQLKKRKEDNGK